MKQAAHTIAVAALGACLSGCGGGTLAGIDGGAGSPGAGAGGISGHGGWELGTAGSFVEPCFFRPPPPVCGDLCGNGRIDECTSPPAPGCPAVTSRELCDRNDLGGDGCQQRGYGSGELACSSDCTLGMDSCSPCVPQPGLVVSCRPGPVAAPNFAQHVMAANDSEIGLAVAEYDDSSTTERLLFERLSPDLGMLSVTTIEQFSQQPRVSFNGLAAASLSSGGWIIAVCGSADIYFHTVDAAGRARGRVVVAPSFSGYGCQAGDPVLAASPNGGPLLLWQDDAGVWMSVIAADGLSASPPRALRGATTWADNPTAAWIGNEFVVALAVAPEADPTSNVRSLRLMRIASDGTPHLVGDFLTGEFVSGATMASGADARDVRILYWGVPPGGDPNTDGGPFWWRYAPAGQVPPSTFDSPVGSYPPPPGVAFGDDTVVLFSRELGDGFGVARLASDGRVVSPYRDLFRNPLSYGGGAAIARRGPEFIVSFGSPTRIHLARLTP